MNVIESRFKNRQLHVEYYLQTVSEEKKEHTEVFDYSGITEKSGIIIGHWTNNLLALILRKDSLNNGYKQVEKYSGKVEMMVCRWMNFFSPYEKNEDTLGYTIMLDNYLIIYENEGTALGLNCMSGGVKGR